MKFSALPVSFYADFATGARSLGEWFRFAATLGLDGADISVAHLQTLSANYLDALRREAEDAGVQIAMVVTYSDFTHPDAQERMHQREEVRGFIDVAARLGAPLYVSPLDNDIPVLLKRRAWIGRWPV
ncbi:MAG: TIM barrel protein [Caldilineaceae bacterium]